jgi:cobalt-zinc-cadmium resistance protein CzcA
VTVVFEDSVDDYFARQLVAERLQSVRSTLPAGVDVQLGPISTGLGEIFQYRLVSSDPKYDVTELRTIQDYIVRPILRTVPGVTDVNSFGGLVKQYQVIVNPDRLVSLGITLSQVFEALEKNNANASGNFIEHQSEQYIVRGLGQVRGVQDIANIIVAVHEHAPIYVRDVADVRIGAELRQGAFTANGEGEGVAGIVLMLKGASGRDVVNAVKARLPAIAKALPKSVELATSTPARSKPCSTRPRRSAGRSSSESPSSSSCSCRCSPCRASRARCSRRWRSRSPSRSWARSSSR